MGPTTDVLKRIETAIGVTCLALMFLIICLNVFMRYVLTAPIFWAEEMSNFLFVWAGFLSCAHVLADDRHLRVTLFVGLLPAAVRRWIALAMTVLLTVVFGTFIWPSVVALESLNVTAALQMPELYPYAILPLVMTLCFVHSAIRVLSIGMHIASGGRETAS